ncbi:MAG: type VII toxin-antitoxin system HepT family RNase toxin [Anaerolineae bacterium]
MTGINRQIVHDRAREIREAVQKVQQYAALPDETFFADERNLYTVEHLLLIAIEAAAALCNHILAKTARRAPLSYGECFEGLQRVHKLDEQLAVRLVQMARFRNLLVHRYWDVDATQVLAYARHNLGDFEAYLRAIAELVGQPV